MGFQNVKVKVTQILSENLTNDDRFDLILL